MKANNFLKNNWFFFTMILGIVLGIVVGFMWPGAGALEPLGTLFINMMFCVVVPMVFFSISSSIANMKSAKRDGHYGNHLYVHDDHRICDYVCDCTVCSDLYGRSCF